MYTEIEYLKRVYYECLLEDFWFSPEYRSAVVLNRAAGNPYIDPELCHEGEIIYHPFYEEDALKVRKVLKRILKDRHEIYACYIEKAPDEKLIGFDVEIAEEFLDNDMRPEDVSPDKTVYMLPLRIHIERCPVCGRNSMSGLGGDICPDCGYDPWSGCDSICESSLWYELKKMAFPDYAWQKECADSNAIKGILSGLSEDYGQNEAYLKEELKKYKGYHIGKEIILRCAKRRYGMYPAKSVRTKEKNELGRVLKDAANCLKRCDYDRGFELLSPYAGEAILVREYIDLSLSHWPYRKILKLFAETCRRKGLDSIAESCEWIVSRHYFCEKV